MGARGKEGPLAQRTGRHAEPQHPLCPSHRSWGLGVAALKMAVAARPICARGACEVRAPRPGHGHSSQPRGAVGGREAGRGGGWVGGREEQREGQGGNKGAFVAGRGRAALPNAREPCW